MTAADLVDGEADGLHVLALPPFLSAIFLHEGDQEAAVRMAGCVRVLQCDLELGVDPKGGWKEQQVEKVTSKVRFSTLYLLFIHLDGS